MKASSLHWSAADGWLIPMGNEPRNADLVLCFTSPALLSSAEGPVAELRSAFPKAVILAASTAGEIAGTMVCDDSVSALALRFEATKVLGVSVRVEDATKSWEAGEQLAQLLPPEGLRHVLVLGAGNINGSQLAQALEASLPKGVAATGGLAGDGVRFKNSIVAMGTECGSDRLVAVGLYGDRLRVSHGSAGGWQAFGPKRLVTSAEGNLLKSLDGQPALALYKRFLGERAAGLPATALLFPLQIIDPSGQGGIVRTILNIDEEKQALIFAGDIPVGAQTRLMRAGFDALVEGASLAVEAAAPFEVQGDKAALLVSCVGRRLVMGQRIEEEVEAVLSRLGLGVHAAGFYSYGEFCPGGNAAACELHNQTMTLTVLGEAGA